jgi:hypothetical protein
MGRANLAAPRGRRDDAALVRLALPAMLVLAALALAAATQASRPRPLRPFRGAGTWVSVYDTHALRHPEAVVRRLRRHRIHTLFLETGNERSRHAVAHPVAVARFLEAAHDAGLAVVGWYLPSFRAPRADVRRALQGARFRSPRGDRFDAFALDIESTKVRLLRRRSARAVWVARAVRLHLPRRVALGAISIDPAGARYWRGYPFRRLARSVQVFLPMEYFTDRTRGARRVAAYSRANVRLVRRLAGDPGFPVHPIGGDAGEASLAELRAFLRASRREVGVSLWEYGETSSRQLTLLGAARR